MIFSGFENIPNQFFRVGDVGKFKVDALKEIIKDFTGVDIQANDIEVRRLWIWNRFKLGFCFCSW